MSSLQRHCLKKKKLQLFQALLLEIVAKLENANGDIVEHIQTISAITEEVSAHAGETYQACEDNISVVADVTGLVESLSAEAEKLREVKA